MKNFIFRHRLFTASMVYIDEHKPFCIVTPARFCVTKKLFEKENLSTWNIVGSVLEEYLMLLKLKRVFLIRESKNERDPSILAPSIGSAKILKFPQQVALNKKPVQTFWILPF